MSIESLSGLTRRHALLLMGTTAASGALVSCAASPPTLAPKTPSANRRYDERPEIMAVGDSLYQGVRSLTFTSELAPHSPPAQVARSLGCPMAVPDPSYPLLFDVEQALRLGGAARVLVKVRERCIENMGQWSSGAPWSRAGHQAFDNVAIGGAKIASLYTDTYARYRPGLEPLAQRIRSSPIPDVAAIGDLWYALNVCFTLNPMRRDEQAHKSQLDQVHDRRPDTLLVNIGSNEGLFNAAFMGDIAGQWDSVQDIPRKPEMVELAERLAALPRDVKTIVFNSLVRPRATPNLMPLPGEAARYPGDAYFSAYAPWITGSRPVIPGEKVREFDRLTLEVNRGVEALLRRKLGSRLKYVDLYAASTERDGKHYANRSLRVEAPNGRVLHLVNRPLVRSGLYIRRAMFDGGLTGLDNMHPTVPGYAVMADAVLAALGYQGPPINKNDAFKSDTLLIYPPPFARTVQTELRQLGALGVFEKRGQRAMA